MALPARFAHYDALVDLVVEELLRGIAEEMTLQNDARTGVVARPGVDGNHAETPARVKSYRDGPAAANHS